MNINECTKYFDFLTSECDRFLSDKKIEEEEIQKMQNELFRFKELSKRSELPKEIKKIVEELNLTYQVSERNEYFKLLALATLGYWYIIYEKRKARKMANCIHDFKTQVSQVSMFLKLNYD